MDRIMRQTRHLFTTRSTERMFASSLRVARSFAIGHLLQFFFHLARYGGISAETMRDRRRPSTFGERHIRPRKRIFSDHYLCKMDISDRWILWVFLLKTVISVRRTVKVCVHKDVKRIKPISKSVLSLDSCYRSTKAISATGRSCWTLRSHWDSYCSVSGAERRSGCVCLGLFSWGYFFWTLHWRTSSIRRTCQSVVLCQCGKEMLAILSLQSVHSRLGQLKMPIDASTITLMLVIHIGVIGSGN